MRIWNVPVVDSIDFIKEMEVEADEKFSLFGSWAFFEQKAEQDYLYINDDMLRQYIEDMKYEIEQSDEDENIEDYEEDIFWAEIALKVLKNNNIEQLLIDDCV